MRSQAEASPDMSARNGRMNIGTSNVASKAAVALTTWAENTGPSGGVSRKRRTVSAKACTFAWAALALTRARSHGVGESLYLRLGGLGFDSS